MDESTERTNPRKGRIRRKDDSTKGRIRWRTNPLQDVSAKKSNIGADITPPEIPSEKFDEPTEPSLHIGWFQPSLHIGWFQKKDRSKFQISEILRGSQKMDVVILIPKMIQGQQGLPPNDGLKNLWPGESRGTRALVITVNVG